MILYLYGGDSYLRTRKLRELIVQYGKKHGHPDAFEADLEENPARWQDLSVFLEQPSMFSDSKLAIVRETGEVDEKNEKKWVKILKGELATDKTFLIAVDRKGPKKVFRFLTESPARAQEFPELSGAALAGFLNKESAERELHFTADAFRLFSETVAASPEPGWSAVRHLDRLVLLKKDRRVEKEDIEKSLPISIHGELFGLIKNVLSATEPKAALVALERALHQADPAYVFNFAASLARGNALLAFSEYDIAIKSGKLGYEEALADFVLGGERLDVFA